jgi:hypothetical protein
VLYVRRFSGSFSPQRRCFNRSDVDVRSVEDRVTVGHGFLPVYLRCPLLIIIQYISEAQETSCVSCTIYQIDQNVITAQSCSLVWDLFLARELPLG